MAVLICIVNPAGATISPSRYFDSDTCYTCHDTYKRSILTGAEDTAGDYYQSGEVLYEEGNYEQALLNFDHTILVLPTHWMAWMKKGESLYELGRYEEALAASKKASRLGAHDDDGFSREVYAIIWNDIGRSCMKLGQYEEAFDAFNEAVDLDPGDNMDIYLKNRDVAENNLN